MNVYDFDKTIYDGDSTTDFSLFVLSRRPWMFYHLFAVAYSAAYSAVTKDNKEYFKKVLYRYLKHVDDIDKEVELFWNRNEKKIKSWYLEQRKDDDVVASASSYFLLNPLAKKYGFNLIASDVDKKTGKLLSLNNECEIKAKTFLKKYPNAIVDEFYSDSDHDLALAKLAIKAYKVKGNKITEWEF